MDNQQCWALVWIRGDEGSPSIPTRCARAAKEGSEFCWQHVKGTPKRWSDELDVGKPQRLVQKFYLDRDRTDENPQRAILEKLEAIEGLLARQVDLLHKMVRANDLSGALRIAHDVFEARDVLNK